MKVSDFSAPNSLYWEGMVLYSSGLVLIHFFTGYTLLPVSMVIIGTAISLLSLILRLSSYTLRNHAG